MSLVSAVIPTYNRAGMLEEAIDSVAGQTFRDCEIIVVDDGSVDRTKDVVRKYGGLVRYIFHENQGRSRTRNAGIRAARGAYVSFLDDDDIWYPRKLESQVAVLESQPDIDFVYGSVHVLQDGRRELVASEPFPRETLIERLIFTGAHVIPGGASNVMIRRTTLLESGLFDPGMEPLEDLELWTRIALRGGRPAYVNESLVEYRMHGANTVDNRMLMRSALVTVLEKLFRSPETPASIKVRLRCYLSRQWRAAGIDRYMLLQLPAARAAWRSALKLDPSVATLPLLFMMAKSLCGRRILQWGRERQPNRQPWDIQWWRA